MSKPLLRGGEEFVRSSILLQRLHDDAPTGDFTLSWLLASLGERSYGMIMLLLATVAIAPGISIVAGLLLALSMAAAVVVLTVAFAAAWGRHLAPDGSADSCRGIAASAEGDGPERVRASTGTIGGSPSWHARADYRCAGAPKGEGVRRSRNAGASAADSHPGQRLSTDERRLSVLPYCLR
jgi:hypothetical protein